MSDQQPNKQVAERKGGGSKEGTKPRTPAKPAHLTTSTTIANQPAPLTPGATPTPLPSPSVMSRASQAMSRSGSNQSLRSPKPTHVNFQVASGKLAKMIEQKEAAITSLDNMITALEKLEKAERRMMESRAIFEAIEAVKLKDYLDKIEEDLPIEPGVDEEEPVQSENDEDVDEGIDYDMLAGMEEEVMESSEPETGVKQEDGMKEERVVALSEQF